MNTNEPCCTYTASNAAANRFCRRFEWLVQNSAYDNATLQRILQEEYDLAVKEGFLSENDAFIMTLKREMTLTYSSEELLKGSDYAVDGYEN